MRNYLKRAVPKTPQDRRNLENTVRDMLDEIKEKKDTAVTEYAKNLDKWSRGSFLVTQDEIMKVSSLLPDSFKQDFDKRNYIVSNSKLENAGWVPTFTLEDGIKELIKGYQLIKKFKDKDFTNL